MGDTVTLDRLGGVAILAINRPERMNAINAATGELLERGFVEAATDPTVRVIVLTGAGDRAFCAGADAERLQDLSGAAAPARQLRAPGEPSVLDVFETSPPGIRTRYTLPLLTPKPVIAAINGACAGVGLALAVACDIRFASSTAAFASAFARRGLTAEAGLAWTLPRLVGHGAAADILLSARKFGADEAHAMGLVNRVEEPAALLPAAMAYAKDLTENCSPRSLRTIKQQLSASASQSIEAAMALSWEFMLTSLESADFREGVDAFRDGRKPTFSGE